MHFAKTISALILSTVALGAQAAPITQTLKQTVTGQDFVFTFDNLSSNFTGVGSITLTARGDYSTGASSENIQAVIDGVNLGTFGYADGDAGSTTFFSGDDTRWSRTFNFSHSVLANYLADGKLVFNANLSPDVNVFSTLASVTVSFNYTPVVLSANKVPEPGSMVLLGAAFAAASLARRRKQSV